jgi:hypothetical protein
MSRASDLFSAIEEKGISFIDDLIQNKISEEFFLDYKCVTTPDGAKRIEEEDKKKLGKAISGFGNSDGGVIIWGVDCRTTKDKGDLPTGYQADAVPALKEFSPKWWKSLLESFVSGATMPAHQGVRHIALFRPGKNDGIVATYIPPGLNAPYRSLVDGRDNYYIRAGSDFIPAPHAVLAGLFGRAPQPIIKLNYEFSPKKWLSRLSDPGHDPALWLDLIVSVTNTGRGIANELFALIDVPSTSFVCRNHPFMSGWDLTMDTSTAWEGPTMAVAQPSLNRLPPGGTLNFIFSIVELHRPQEFKFEMTVGARGGPSDSIRIHVTSDKVKELSEIYHKTPLAQRHNNFTVEKMTEKLEQAC